MLVASTAIGMSSAAACGSPEHAADDGRRPAVPVATARAAMVDVADRLEAGGVVVARESAVVASRMVAPVVAVRVTAGDRVRAGDVLVTLDDRDVAAHARQAGAALTAAEQGLATAQADAAAAQAEQKLAAAWHSRIAALHARKSATAQELDEAEARLASANARAAAAQSRIDGAGSAVAASRNAAEAASVSESFAVLRAPFDGIVTERLTDPGNLASPGSPLLRIDAAGERRVEVSVDEARVGYIRPGDRVEVLVDAGSAGTGEEAFEGRVAEVARAVAAGQRAFTVKVTIPAATAARTGTFARVRFRGPSRAVVVVPAAAVRRQGQVASVFVVDDSTARLRLIRTGRTVPEGVEVLAGLDAGELVVAGPPAALVDGSPVTTGAAPAETGAR
jgi:RND family efflux transporter MFP subunit